MVARTTNRKRTLSKRASFGIEEDGNNAAKDGNDSSSDDNIPLATLTKNRRGSTEPSPIVGGDGGTQLMICQEAGTKFDRLTQLFPDAGSGGDTTNSSGVKFAGLANNGSLSIDEAVKMRDALRSIQNDAGQRVRALKEEVTRIDEAGGNPPLELAVDTSAKAAGRQGSSSLDVGQQPRQVKRLKLGGGKVGSGVGMRGGGAGSKLSLDEGTGASRGSGGRRSASPSTFSTSNGSGGNGGRRGSRGEIRRSASNSSLTSSSPKVTPGSLKVKISLSGSGAPPLNLMSGAEAAGGGTGAAGGAARPRSKAGGAKVGSVVKSRKRKDAGVGGAGGPSPGSAAALSAFDSDFDSEDSDVTLAAVSKAGSIGGGGGTLNGGKGGGGKGAKGAKGGKGGVTLSRPQIQIPASPRRLSTTSTFQFTDFGPIRESTVDLKQYDTIPLADFWDETEDHFAHISDKYLKLMLPHPPQPPQPAIAPLGNHYISEMKRELSSNKVPFKPDIYKGLTPDRLRAREVQADLEGEDISTFPLRIDVDKHFARFRLTQALIYDHWAMPLPSGIELPPPDPELDKLTPAQLMALSSSGVMERAVRNVLLECDMFRQGELPVPLRENPDYDATTVAGFKPGDTLDDEICAEIRRSHDELVEVVKGIDDRKAAIRQGTLRHLNHEVGKRQLELEAQTIEAQVYKIQRKAQLKIKKNESDYSLIVKGRVAEFKNLPSPPQLSLTENRPYRLKDFPPPSADLNPHELLVWTSLPIEHKTNHSHGTRKKRTPSVAIAQAFDSDSD